MGNSYGKNNTVHLLLAVIGIILALLSIPEVRIWLGLEKKQMIETPIIPIEQKQTIEGHQTIKGSQIQEIPYSKNLENNRKDKNTSKSQIPSFRDTENAINNVRPTSMPKEDHGLYLNKSISNTGETDISVTIVDENRNLSSALSSSIADIYTQGGYNGKIGLFKSTFLNKPAFKELMEGSSEIIQVMHLNEHTDYVAIGVISYTPEKGTEVQGTYVCTANLSMNIISVGEKSLKKTFPLQQLIMVLPKNRLSNWRWINY